MTNDISEGAFCCTTCARVYEDVDQGSAPWCDSDDCPDYAINRKLNYKPDPRIKPYLDHLEREVRAYVSSSHATLHKLNCEHGEETVRKLLDDHWNKLRQRHYTKGDSK